MVNPFLKLVGLRGNGTAQSYVNDLPGISTELVAALENSDATEVSDVWNRVHAAAYDRIQSEIEAQLSGDNTYSPTIAKTMEPQPLDGAIDPTDEYQGVALSVPPVSNSRVKLINLVFMADIASSVTAEVIVMDLKRTPHREIQRKNYLILPGVNRLPVEINYNIDLLDTPNLFVGIHIGELRLIRLSLPAWNKPGYRISSASYFGGIASVNAPEAYVYLEAEHQRTITATLPRFAEQLRFAYLNLCAHLLLTEKLSSSNFNLFTNTNRLATQEMADKHGEDFLRLLKPVARLIRNYLLEGGNLNADPEDNQGYYVESLV